MKKMKFFHWEVCTRRTLFASTLLVAVSFGHTGTVHATQLEIPAVNQQKGVTIKGLVLDEQEEPVIGATIQVKGITGGVISDMDGKFAINVPDLKRTLVITYIGYNPQEIKLNNTNFLKVQLKEESQQLNEVVVVAYGQQKKESVVGAITTVGGEALMKSGNLSVTNAMAGKLSGVLTMQGGGGQPGSNKAEVVIRGLSSWNGSGPLTMVDGVERDYRDLDPSEISSISVLKDASATAVFGAKGANGVILVTTKRGTANKPKLSANFSTGVEVATRIPEFIDSYTTMSLLKTAAMNNQAWGELRSDDILNEYRNPSTRLNSLRYPNVNWFDLLTNNYAPSSNANINIQGGTDFVRYFGSLGWYNQGSFFKSYDDGGYGDTQYSYNRINYRINLDFSLTKSTTLSLNVGGDIGMTNTPGASPWYGLYASSPSLYPAYYPEWALEEVPDLDYPDAKGIRFVEVASGSIGDNPYTQLNNGSFNRYTSSKLFTDVVLEQKLDMLLKGLSIKGKASLSTYYKNKSLTASHSVPSYRLDFEKIGTGENPWSRQGQSDNVYVESPYSVGTGGLEGGYYRNVYYEVALNYANRFGNHSVTGLALFNRSNKRTEAGFPYYNQGVSGRATYDYSHKYLFEVNIGYTGSEQFAPENRYGFFPSGAIGWVISEEVFFKKAFPWIDKLKIRYSDGLVGSDNSSDRWLYISEYSLSGSYIKEDKIANKSTQWEEAHKQDLGFEFGFLNNSLQFNVSLYQERRDKMLLTPRNVTMLVGNSFKALNKGKMKKHGCDFELEYNKQLTRNWAIHARGLLSLNENRVVFKDDLLYAPEYRKSAGKPVDSKTNGVELSGGGYFTSVDDIHNSLSPIAIGKLVIGDYKFVDYNADGKINTEDLHSIKGTKYAPMIYSFGGGFSYKNFDFNMLFQGNAGKYVDYGGAFEYEYFRGDYRLHAAQMNYWTPENPGANHATLHYIGPGDDPNIVWTGGSSYNGYGGAIDGRNWRKADYLRLKEIYLSYTFNTNFLKRKLGISNLVIYGTGNNVFTVTSLVEGDPEATSFNTGFYPLMSSYNIGLKIGF